MKRNLQEGRRARGTQIIYEGNGFAKVMKGGKLVERVQLEKGDNLLESLRALTLLEGKFKPTSYKETGIDGAKLIMPIDEEYIIVAGDEDDGFGLVIQSESDEYDEVYIQIEGLATQDEAEKLGEDIVNKVGLKPLLDMSKSGIARKLKGLTSANLDILVQ